MFSLFVQLGMNFKQIKHELPVIHIETFNSMKKRAGVVFRSRDGEVQVHWKGAAEMILDQCTAWLDSDGSTYPLTPEKIAEWRKVIEGMAALTLRCIAFAYSPIEESEVPTNEEDLANWKAPENDLIFTAIAGIKDPRRPGVREAVEKCQRAGVKVGLHYLCAVCWSSRDMHICHFSILTLVTTVLPRTAIHLCESCCWLAR
jgi:Ca2+-transporting ATPase